MNELQPRPLACKLQQSGGTALCPPQGDATSPSSCYPSHFMQSFTVWDSLQTLSSAGPTYIEILTYSCPCTQPLVSVSALTHSLQYLGVFGLMFSSGQRALSFIVALFRLNSSVTSSICTVTALISTFFPCPAFLSQCSHRPSCTCVQLVSFGGIKCSQGRVLCCLAEPKCWASG